MKQVRSSMAVNNAQDRYHVHQQLLRTIISEPIVNSNTVSNSNNMEESTIHTTESNEVMEDVSVSSEEPALEGGKGDLPQTNTKASLSYYHYHILPPPLCHHIVVIRSNCHHCMPNIIIIIIVLPPCHTHSLFTTLVVSADKTITRQF